jgi:deoxyadenosine/deoxycytidine kinase
MTSIISIEGNIGSGKSTLVAELEKHFNVIDEVGFLQEPVNIWNTIKDENGITILEKFYENNEKYAFQFQMMAYISRLSIIKKAIKSNKYKYIITERSLYTDANVFAKMLYDDKKISEIEYTIYKMWFDEFITDIPISKIIYVRAEPIVSSQRVIKRNRLGETIPLSYLEKCHIYHENWLYDSKYDMITLDGNHDITKQHDIMPLWISQIKQFILKNIQPIQLDYSYSSESESLENMSCDTESSSEADNQ